jgi:MFS family permease
MIVVLMRMPEPNPAKDEKRGHVSRLPATSDDDQLWRMRWLLLGSTILITLSLITLIATQPTHWHWTLLGWGVLIGVAYATYLWIVFGDALRRKQHSPEQRTRLTRRRLIYVISSLFFSTVAGVISAALNVVWVDLVLAAYLALVVAASLGVFVVLSRRNRQ